MFNFLKRAPKEKLNCLGFYDSKPYHSLEYALIYAQEKLIRDDKDVKVFARNFHGTVFVVSLVAREMGADPEQYTYQALKKEIHDKGIEPGNNSIQVMIFKENNEITRAIAKKSVVNTKSEFHQCMVYNSEAVRLEYYRPVPKFYKLYDHFAELIYFDLAGIDPTR